MNRCPGCQRHVLPIAVACPFCRASALAKSAGVVVTPLILSACYGAPPCTATDDDGDGWSECDDYYFDLFDCNDFDPSISPDAVEVCDDALDNNCDGIAASVTGAEVCGNALDDDCDGEVDEIDDCPPPVDTGDTDTDTDIGATTGRLSIHYVFAAAEVVDTCAAAGLSNLSVTLVPADGTPPDPIATTCTDVDIMIDDLEPGAYALGVHGESADVRSWDSGPVPAEVRAGETRLVDVTLTCSSTFDDGCGGG